MKKMENKEVVNYRLIVAVREGELDRVKQLVNSYGLSYSQAWSQGYVLLCSALKNKHEAVTKLLLTSGSKVNSNSPKPTDTPLHLAVMNNNIEIIEMILNCSANVYAKNEYGKTPLHIAAEMGCLEIVKHLLKRGASANNVGKCKRGYTPLHFAVEKGNTEITTLFLSRGANVDVKDEYCRTPLHIAAEEGNLQIVEHLLNYGAYINCVCTWQRGYTPLHFAVEGGRTEVATLLLNKGANIDAKDEDGITPLHIAARNGYVLIAEDLLNHGACIHSSTLNEGYTPLHFATELYNGEAVELFSNRGADINARTNDNSTPLHIATKKGCKTVVKILLQHGAKVDNQDKDGKTILHLAVENGNLMIVEDVLKHSPDINDRSNRCSLKIAVLRYEGKYKNIVESLLEYGLIVDPEDANDPELLHAAVEKSYLKIVEDLLKYGADVNTLNHSRCKEGFTLLHSAAKNREEEIAKLLISYKADVNAQDKTGKTPIFYAVHNADSKITKLLLTNRADIKGNPELLSMAVKKDCIEIVEDLLQHGTDINASDQFGRTALHFIVLSENGGVRGLRTNDNPVMNIKGGIAKLLLSKGANVNTQMRNGTTTLYAAVQRGYAKVVEALLEYNANIDSVVNIEQKDGIIPLHLAVQEGHEEVVKILLKRGAKVDSKIKNDMTPLHLAAKKGFSGIIETLLKFGADVDSRDEDGRTALHIASDNGHNDVVRILLDYGSDINITTKYYDDTALDYALSRLESSYTPHHRVRGYELTVETLERHIIKMMIANLYLSPAYLRSMRHSDEASDFKGQCEEEIAIMKSEKINNLTISIYDILAKDTSSLVICMRNENIVHVLKSDDYEMKFPIYSRMIENHIKKGIERKELLEQGDKIFHMLSNNLPELPYDCVEKIISYLSDKDLRNLIDACKCVGISDSDIDIKDTETTSNISQVQYVQVEEK